MKKEDVKPMYNKKYQNILNKLIAEEVIAHDLYIGCIMSINKEDVCNISNMFNKIAIDEMDDHCKKLADWAYANDYEVIFKYKDYLKYADEKLVSLFNNLKRNESVEYYFKKAIESEECAIKSYKEVLEKQGNDVPYDLYSILIQNSYDEDEHLRDLQDLYYALQHNAEFINVNQ